MNSNWEGDPPIYRVTWGFIGAMIGGFIVWLMSARELHVRPMGVTYGDLAAIVLTAVTVILAVFGLIAALAALYGYRAFMKVSAATAANIARAEAVPAAITEVKDYLTTKAEPFIVEQAEKVAMRVITPEALQALIREQIDAMALGDQRDNDLDRAELHTAVSDDLDALDDDETQAEE